MRKIVVPAHLVVRVPAAPLPDDDDAGHDRGHEGDAGEGQGHVDAAAALLQLHAANGVALKGGEVKIDFHLRM